MGNFLNSINTSLNMFHHYEDSSASLILADESRSQFLSLLSDTSPKNVHESFNKEEDKSSLKNTNNVLFLSPKTAFEVLLELKPLAGFSTQECDNVVLASLAVDEKIFFGKGCNIKSAVENTAEKALQFFYFQVVVNTALSTNDADKCQYDTEPWKSLASLAVFKLMKEWLQIYKTDKLYKQQYEHYIHRNLQTRVQKNYKKKFDHPISFLNHLAKQNMNFTDYVVIDNLKEHYKSVLKINNVEYEGEPCKSKKGARQSVATKVLLDVYGIKF